VIVGWKKARTVSYLAVFACLALLLTECRVLSTVLFLKPLNQKRRTRRFWWPCFFLESLRKKSRWVPQV